VTKLARDYGIRLQTTHDIKNNRIKLMDFVRDCCSGFGPSNCKSMKKFSCRVVDVALLQWFR
jgi:hypothetical protein